MAQGQTAQAAVAVVVAPLAGHLVLVAQAALALNTQSPQAVRLVLAAAVVVAADLKGLEAPAV